MNNIFRHAYFGKSYKTRDNRKFVYLGKVKSLFGHNSAIQGMIEDNDVLTYYNSEGKSLYCEYKGSAINAFDIDFSQVICEEDCETDIVPELQEVNEEELDKTVENIVDTFLISDYSHGNISYGQLKNLAKACCRKAMELIRKNKK